MNAQEISSGSWCGAEPSPEAIAMMNSLQPQVNEYTARFLENRGRLPVATVPIRPHIIRRSDGTGGYTQAEFDAALEIVNNYYQNANLQFVQCGPANYIDNDQFFDFDYSEQNELLRSPEGEYNSGVIDLYIPGGILTANGGSLCGYALFPWQTPASFFVVRRACMDRGNTFAHELGHYLGLYHTHGKNNCGLSDELANGSNCGSAGDDVCDTPADPNLSGLNCQFLLVSQGCNYIGTYTDTNGQPYNPDVSNVMSYAPPGCRATFTAGQYARASFYYNEYRAATLACEGTGNSSCPTPANLSVTEFGQTSIDVTWEPAEGAVAYQARYRHESGSWIERAWSPSTFLMLNNLSPCMAYEIQVRADCGGDEFSSYSSVLRVFTEGCGASLEASPEFIDVSSDAGFAIVTVSTSLEWTASEIFSWMGITRGSGIGSGSFRVNFTENPSANTRAAFLTVNAGGLSKTVSLTQEGQDAYLTVSPGLLNVGPEAGFINFNINSNASWRVSKDAEWLSLSPADGSNSATVTVDYQGNTSTESREASIQLAGEGGLIQILAVLQAGVAESIAASPAGQEADAPGGCLSFSITANTAWSASYSAAWISSVTPASGYGNATVEVCYEANTADSGRSATFTFSNGGASAQAYTSPKNSDQQLS